MGMSSLSGLAGAVNSPTDRWMHALRARHRGGPEQLVDEQAPRPPLAIGDVLVRVHAASFTPTELGWPSTWTDRLGRERTPVTPPTSSPGWLPRSASAPVALPWARRSTA
jgi:hypothetical protein